MTLRHTVGILSTLGATVSAGIYLATWLGFIPFERIVWPLFFGTALTFATSSMAAHVLKPDYRVDRVLQLQRLRPFLSEREYKLVWYAFFATMIGIVLGVIQVAATPSIARVVQQIFAAGWFGAFAIDSLVLLRAKLPSVHGSRTSEA